MSGTGGSGTAAKGNTIRPPSWGLLPDVASEACVEGRARGKNGRTLGSCEVRFGMDAHSWCLLVVEMTLLTLL